MDGRQVAEARERRGESQQEFAVALSAELGKKIDAVKVNKWESGQEKVHSDVEGVLTLSEVQYKPNGTHPATVISSTNLKGGCSKTSVAVNLSYVLAKSGARTLLIDADSQGNSTLHVGILDKEAQRLDMQHRTLYDVLTGEAEIAQVVRQTSVPNLSLIPSYTRLFAADDEMSGELNVLRQRLEAIQGEFDFIVLDCAPSLHAVTRNCLVASRYALIPVQTEPHALNGLARMLHTVAEIRRGANRQLEVLGIVPTMHQPRVSQNKDSLLELHDNLGRKHPVYPAIPRSSFYPMSAAVNMITLQYERNAPGLRTFVEIAQALVQTRAEVEA